MRITCNFVSICLLFVLESQCAPIDLPMGGISGLTDKLHSLSVPALGGLSAMSLVAASEHGEVADLGLASSSGIAQNFKRALGPLGGIPGLSSLPSTDSLPGLSSLSSMNSLPELSALPVIGSVLPSDGPQNLKRSLGSLGSIPGLSTLSSVNSLPGLSSLSLIDSLPELSSLPVVGSISPSDGAQNYKRGLGSLGSIPGLSPMSSMGSLPGLSSMSSMSSIPSVPSISSIPSTPSMSSIPFIN